MKKIFLLLILICSSSFAVDFAIIQLTENEALNYFFSFPIYIMLISLPFVAVLQLIKKV